jgi:hypothetical protein
MNQNRRRVMKQVITLAAAGAGLPSWQAPLPNRDQLRRLGMAGPLLGLHRHEAA